MENTEASFKAEVVLLGGEMCYIHGTFKLDGDHTKVAVIAGYIGQFPSILGMNLKKNGQALVSSDDICRVVSSYVFKKKVIAIKYEGQGYIVPPGLGDLIVHVNDCTTSNP